MHNPSENAMPYSGKNGIQIKYKILFIRIIKHISLNINSEWNKGHIYNPYRVILDCVARLYELCGINTDFILK